MGLDFRFDCHFAVLGASSLRPDRRANSWKPLFLKIPHDHRKIIISIAACQVPQWGRLWVARDTSAKGPIESKGSQMGQPAILNLYRARDLQNEE